MKKNVPFLGFIIGALLPLLGFFILSKLWGHGLSVTEFWRQIKTDNKICAKVYTMSLLINFIPFLYYKSKRLDYTMNGVIVATMLYAVYIVLLMFVWS